MKVDDFLAQGETPASLEKLIVPLEQLPRPKEQPNQAQVLVDIGSRAELFHTPEREAYALCPVGGHSEAYSISERGGGLRDYLILEYYRLKDQVPSSTALTDATGILRAKAMLEGPTRKVYTRLAWEGDRLFLDLANDARDVIEISSTGWTIATDPPVIFRRPKGIQALPRPVQGGTLDDLRRFINVQRESDWMLVVGWLVGTLKPYGAMAHLALAGEQGSAKTTATRLLRGIIDPNDAGVRKEPKDERDLVLAARNGLIVTLDNASRLSDDLSDGLCRLSTGAAISTRKLYTDDEEAFLVAKRPAILNGIIEIVTRGDLSDRTITIELQPIAEAQRRTEADMDAEYDALRPSILGGLLDAASAALRNWGTTRLDRSPRMADFARWVEAAAPALGWKPRAFLTAYANMGEDATATLLEASPIGRACQDFAHGLPSRSWTGTAEDLLLKLNAKVAYFDRPKGWPGSPRALADALRRLAPAARGVGISLDFHRQNAKRLWTIQVIDLFSGGVDDGDDSRGFGDEGDDRPPYGDDIASPIVTDFQALASLEPRIGDEGDDIFPTLSVRIQRKEEEEGGSGEEEARSKSSPDLSSPSSPSSPGYFSGENGDRVEGDSQDGIPMPFPPDQDVQARQVEMILARLRDVRARRGEGVRNERDS